ncbi:MULTISPECIES: putative quinol monooxygenase [Gluconobacter]|uniref:ABM domain-containing protein n=1 Tax=Gluconobacter kondonii TaxID=941463 RepID=A0ABQ5WSU7_9PROT|nr:MULTISPECIES: putative quinol monooxygenase [Gluconobacter]MBN3867936.1 antibiotic biosynthesis monooxygenase [Gluconobacter kondonii]MBS1054228.1 antibiotic biosynthesis monooxygenase [Gluconobacter kondonii]MBS1057626.1 antibiotic biosynthesis monooxygenase [Gluconobacter kondonii]MBS1066630.1 antibiotic biosynthesis monooxygenase [Gluconobacter kondonii]MBS1075898.1 antibiotic biosynthesis monooxygenase [Gluconobacter sp. Dm-73]
MSQTVHITAVVTVAADHAAAAEHAFAACIVSSRKEEACRQYVVSRDIEKTGRLVVSEVWTSEAGFEAHLASPHFKALGEALGKLDAQLDIMKVRPLDEAADAV